MKITRKGDGSRRACCGTIMLMRNGMKIVFYDDIHRVSRKTAEKRILTVRKVWVNILKTFQKYGYEIEK